MIEVLFHNVLEIVLAFGKRNQIFEHPLVSNEAGPTIVFQLVDKDRSPIDLTDKQVGITVSRDFKNKTPIPLAVSGCNLTESISGVCEYRFSASDLVDTGIHFAELTIIDEDGSRETCPDPIRFDVRESFRNDFN